MTSGKHPTPRSADVHIFDQCDDFEGRGDGFVLLPSVVIAGVMASQLTVMLCAHHQIPSLILSDPGVKVGCGDAGVVGGRCFEVEVRRTWGFLPSVFDEFLQRCVLLFSFEVQLTGVDDAVGLIEQLGLEFAGFILSGGILGHVVLAIPFLVGRVPTKGRNGIIW